MRTYPTSYRAFVAVLETIGAQKVRHKGSHEQWRLPNGQNFTVVTSPDGYTGRTAVNRWTALKRQVPGLRSDGSK